MMQWIKRLWCARYGHTDWQHLSVVPDVIRCARCGFTITFPQPVKP